MKSPFRNLRNSLRSRISTNEENNASSAVSHYELIAFLLCIPSMMVFPLGFLFTVGNIYCAKLLAFGKHKLASFLIVAVNLAFIPSAIHFNRLHLWTIEAPQLLVIIAIPLTLFLLGLYARSKQVAKHTSQL